MKKIVLNMSDAFYEKVRFEALRERRNVTEILLERIHHKPFHAEVEEVFEAWMDQEFKKITKD